MLPKGLGTLKTQLGTATRTKQQEVVYRELEELDRQLQPSDQKSKGIVEGIEKAAGSHQMSGGTGSGCPCCGK